MTISRGQMNRQLYESGGIMSLSKEGIGGGDYRGIDMGSRTGFGILKKISRGVKKAVKGVSKIAKSDLGKAALIGAAAFGIPGTSIGGIFGRAGFGGAATGLFGQEGIAATLAAGKAKFFPKLATTPLVDADDVNLASMKALKKTGENVLTGNLGKIATLGAVTTFLTKTLGMPPEQAEAELARDPSTYLEQYYRNLNPPTADTNSEEYEAQVRDFVVRNTSEYAVGGRVGFAEGTYGDFEEFMKKRGMAIEEFNRNKILEEFMRYMKDQDPTVEAAQGGRIGFANGPVLPPDPTQPVNPFGPKPGDFGIEEDIPIKMASNIENDKILEALFEKYLDMGLSPKDAAKAAQEEFERMSMKPIRETRGVAALGGRMGFDEGTKNPVVDSIMGLEEEEIQIPMDEAQGLPSILDKFGEAEDYGDKVVIITYDENGNQELKVVPRSEVMGDNYMMDKIIKPNQIIPRDNKAKGDSASMNAMQAASVEGLPVRKNKAGVRELDLRKTGGFIPPVGIKEKADDIPAMLSNNEFVFTADAVRAAGGGDVNVGAQRMYDTMKRLEAGGTV